MSFACTLFSDKGRCFNQSERALYGNFIIKRNVWPSGRCPTKRPEAIHFFVNFEVFKSLYLSKNLHDKHQSWGFCESRCVVVVVALYDYADQ